MNCICICHPETDFYIDTDGAALPAGAVIIFKKEPFIVTEELYINEFLGGEIDVVYQAKDEEFSYLETQIQEQKAEKQGGFFSNFYRTVMGNHRKTHKKKITSIPDTPVTENNSINVLDNFGASYLGNVVNPPNPTNRDNVAEQSLTEKLNDLIVTIFHGISEKVYPDSLHEVLPKVKQYKEIISRFITDTSNKYGVTLSYTS